MRRPMLGAQQLGVLQFVTEHAPVSARTVVEQYGEPRDLARTTILTVLERLREKGYLIRSEAEGVYLYSPALGKAELMHTLVHDFVEEALGGSIAPFVAYLAERRGITREEAAELQRLAFELGQQPGGEDERRADGDR